MNLLLAFFVTWLRLLLTVLCTEPWPSFRPVFWTGAKQFWTCESHVQGDPLRLTGRLNPRADNCLDCLELSEFRSCVKVEVAVLGSRSLIVFMVSGDVKQLWSYRAQKVVKVEVAVLSLITMDVKQLWSYRAQKVVKVEVAVLSLITMDVKQLWSYRAQKVCESRSGRPVPNNNGRKAALKLQSSEGGESRSGRPVPNNNGRKAKLNLNRALSHRVVLWNFTEVLLLLSHFWEGVHYWYKCPLVVLACESLHVCTV